VVEVAANLIDKEGMESLSFANLAKHFGVKAPSLYNHVEGMEGLRRALRLRGLAHLLSVLQRAAVGRSGKEALRAIAEAYRNYARTYPGLYVLTLQATEGDDTEVYEAGLAIVEVVLDASVVTASRATRRSTPPAVCEARCTVLLRLKRVEGLGLP
jgi:AcrR family transcriptional regulator